MLPTNYAFHYPASSDLSGYRVENIAQAPYEFLVLGGSNLFDPNPDSRYDAGSVTEVSGTQVQQVYGYLSLLSGFDNQDHIETLAGTTRPRLPEQSTDPTNRVWLNITDHRVIDALAAEITVLIDQAQGFQGIFLDDLDRALSVSGTFGASFSDRFSPFESRNAFMATLQAAVDLKERFPDIPFIANVNSYQFNNTRFDGASAVPQAANDMIDAFVAAMDGVVIEAYWTHANDPNISTVVSGLLGEYRDSGLDVYVSHIFPQDTDRAQVNAYYAHAAAQGFLPTATTDSNFSRIDLSVPVFNQATDRSDVLALLGDPGRATGLAGDDTVFGSEGSDVLLGGDGADSLRGGRTNADLRDLILGGDGDDIIDGGAGNDELRGEAGNDEIIGGAGVDTVIGSGGDDTLTGQAWSDLIFGGEGIDFINGGFGSDRLNGGSDADTFYHAGVEGHGSDWVQDYLAGDGDVLMLGGAAQRSDIQINLARTENAGDNDVDEAFVIYRPTGQILWALVDGGEQPAIQVLLGSGLEVFNI